MYYIGEKKKTLTEMYENSYLYNILTIPMYLVYIFITFIHCV